ncbi:MAG TPA: hypothetical protein VGE47_06265 [Burkholderiaceae bacterium]
MKKMDDHRAKPRTAAARVRGSLSSEFKPRGADEIMRCIRSDEPAQHATRHGRRQPGRWADKPVGAARLGEVTTSQLLPFRFVVTTVGAPLQSGHSRDSVQQSWSIHACSEVLVRLRANPIASTLLEICVRLCASNGY